MASSGQILETPAPSKAKGILLTTNYYMCGALGEVALNSNVLCMVNDTNILVVDWARGNAIRVASQCVIMAQPFMISKSLAQELQLTTIVICNTLLALAHTISWCPPDEGITLVKVYGGIRTGVTDVLEASFIVR